MRTGEKGPVEIEAPPSTCPVCDYSTGLRELRTVERDQWRSKGSPGVAMHMYPRVEAEQPPGLGLGAEIVRPVVPGALLQPAASRGTGGGGKKG